MEGELVIKQEFTYVICVWEDGEKRYYAGIRADGRIKTTRYVKEAELYKGVDVDEIKTALVDVDIHTSKRYALRPLTTFSHS